MFGFIVLLIIVGLAIYGVMSFNRLVALRNRVDSAWAQIDVQLKRRHDLIPNLVETVKGYAAHERETLERVVQARNIAVAAQGAQAEDALSGTLKTLFAVTEAYPELKANQNFLQLPGGAHLDGGPHRLCAPVLQRQRAEAEHHDRDLPVDVLRRPGEGHPARVLPDR